MVQTASLEKEDRLPFSSPVCVQVSDNTEREIKSVRGACEILIDWPHSRRGPVYQSTMEVLQSALAGKATAEAAHDVFVAFAKHAGVLVT